MLSQLHLRANLLSDPRSQVFRYKEKNPGRHRSHPDPQSNGSYAPPPPGVSKGGVCPIGCPTAQINGSIGRIQNGVREPSPHHSQTTPWVSDGGRGMGPGKGGGPSRVQARWSGAGSVTRHVFPWGAGPHGAQNGFQTAHSLPLPLDNHKKHY